MKIRRYILICLFCMMGSIGAGAQTMPLGTKMSAYRDFCLMVNKAFRECDTELLSKSIMDCGADGFYFNGEDLLVTYFQDRSAIFRLTSRRITPPMSVANEAA